MKRLLSGKVAPVLAAVCLGTPLLLIAADWALERTARGDPGLGRVAQALLDYAEAHGEQLPPVAVYGLGGKPMLSWRVLVLPHLGQEDLYREFRLDEPWDSPHNLALLPRMPPEYAPPRLKRAKAPPHHTFCHVFHGRRAAFEGREGLHLTHSVFPDGRWRTILVVEAGNPVPWTEPEETPYDPDRPLPRLYIPLKGGFRVATAWADVAFIKKDVSQKELHEWINRDDGDRLTAEW